ncbi:hypothetical protein DFO45_1910 [Azorhizobium sp. AG788]|nr:hypothetical protein DFO45_1910 [Azorhizobium sp. AG788]
MPMIGILPLPHCPLVGDVTTLIQRLRILALGRSPGDDETLGLGAGMQSSGAEIVGQDVSMDVRMALIGVPDNRQQAVAVLLPEPCHGANLPSRDVGGRGGVGTGLIHGHGVRRNDCQQAFLVLADGAALAVRERRARALARCIVPATDLVEIDTMDDLRWQGLRHMRARPRLARGLRDHPPNRSAFRIRFPAVSFEVHELVGHDDNSLQRRNFVAAAADGLAGDYSDLPLDLAHRIAHAERSICAD